MEYTQLNRNSLYDIVADKLEKMILNDLLKVEEKLPSEQVLAERFGVSRNILREALKSLKERGIILVKPGDGIYVTKPDHKVLEDVVHRMVAFSNVKLEHIYEVRCSIEVAACKLAAREADSEDIESLGNIAMNMPKNLHNINDWVEAEFKFHQAVAAASKNILFTSFISAIQGHMRELFTKGYTKPVARDEGIYGHISIVEAIKSRDSVCAEKAMKGHLERSVKLVLDN